ncbi:MAG: FliM/FliN family flagellar motor switch protein [Pseudomonadota bacterium]
MRETLKMADPAGWADDLDRPLPSTRNVLTAEEIDALLRPDLPDDLPVPPEPESVTPRETVLFDDETGRVDIDRQQDAFRAMSARLPLAMSQQTGIKAALSLRDCAAMRSHEMLSRLTGQVGAVACFGSADGRIDYLLCLPDELADAMIALACGAQGSTGRIGNGWKLSAIDCALLEQLLGGFARLFDGELSLQAIETDLPYVLGLVAHNKPVLASYSAEAPGLRTNVFLVAAADLSVADAPSAMPQPGLGTPVTAVLTARIARLSVPLSRLTNLKAGSTLLLGLPADQPVEVLSGGRDGPVAFEGEVGRKGNRMAVRIKQTKQAALKLT